MTATTRPFLAARIEGFIDARSEVLFRCLGWRDQVFGFTGYGTPDEVRVLGRVLLMPKRSENPFSRAAEDFLERRGWRNFMTTVVPGRRVTVTIGAARQCFTTDRGGYLDEVVSGHGLAPGWHSATFQSVSSEPVQVPVLVVSAETDFGIVSDIDDTILTTWLPRPLLAAWNSFVLTEKKRLAIPGMAVMYRELLDENPGAPVFYLSTGAWNVYPFLTRFLERHRFPSGPMLLTDWGPTNTGWFRSGTEHKRAALRRLAQVFPNISWLLVGDDGQHDPSIYRDFAAHLPSRVRAIAIRELSTTEQVLVHGAPNSMSGPLGRSIRGVPVVAAPDGRGLLTKLRSVGLRGVDGGPADTDAVPRDAVPAGNGFAATGDSDADRRPRKRQHPGKRRHPTARRHPKATTRKDQNGSSS